MAPSNEKRTLIVNAALKLFCENGFQQTSTANISKEAGVATGTLFLYFKSKDELINELYKECKMQMAEGMLKGLPQTGTKAVLRHCWNYAIEWALANPYAFRFVHMCKASPVITDATREEVMLTHGFASRLLKDAFKKKELAKMDEAMFFTLFDGLYNATIEHLLRSGGKNKKKVMEQSFEVFWKGVSA